MNAEREKLMRALECCAGDECDPCPFDDGTSNCLKKVMELARKYILSLEESSIAAPMKMTESLKAELTEYVHKRCVEEL